MAETSLATTPPETAPEIDLESGTYEIIRNRLAGFGKELDKRLHHLNDARKGGVWLHRHSPFRYRADYYGS